jgi:lantibiotic modifying enzyme
MIGLLEEYSSYVEKNSPPSYECDFEGHCNFVFTGSAGRALAFWRLYKYNKNSRYLTLAKEYIEGSLSRIVEDKFKEYVGFLNGNAGIYAVAIIIYDTIGD